MCTSGHTCILIDKECTNSAMVIEFFWFLAVVLTAFTISFKFIKLDKTHEIPNYPTRPNGNQVVPMNYQNEAYPQQNQNVQPQYPIPPIDPSLQKRINEHAREKRLPWGSAPDNRNIEIDFDLEQVNSLIDLPNANNNPQQFIQSAVFSNDPQDQQSDQGLLIQPNNQQQPFQINPFEPIQVNPLTIQKIYNFQIIIDSMVNKHLMIFIIFVYLVNNFASYAFTAVMVFFCVIQLILFNYICIFHMFNKPQLQKYSELSYHVWIFSLFIAYFIHDQSFSNLP